MSEAAPGGGSNRVPLAIIVAALILAAAILAAGWMLSHPDAATRCADSGGAWQEAVGKCWYPQTSQPLVEPDEGATAP